MFVLSEKTFLTEIKSEALFYYLNTTVPLMINEQFTRELYYNAHCPFIADIRIKVSFRKSTTTIRRIIVVLRKVN